MNCDGIRGLLSAYLDGELSPGDLLRVEQHLRRCHWCADEVDSLRQTVALVASMDEIEVPLTFHAALHERLVSLGPPVTNLPRVSAHHPHINSRRWAAPAAAAAAAAALAIGLTAYSHPPLVGMEERSHTAQFEAAPVSTPPANSVADNSSALTAPTAGATTGKGQLANDPHPGPATVTPPVQAPVTRDATAPVHDPGTAGVATTGGDGITQPAVLPAKPFYTATFTISSAVEAKALPTLKKYQAVEQTGSWLITVPTASFGDAMNGLTPLLGKPAIESTDLADQIKLAEDQLAKSKTVYNNLKSQFGPQPTAEQAAALKSAGQDVADRQADVDQLNLRVQTSTILVQLLGQPNVQ